MNLSYWKMSVYAMRSVLIILHFVRYRVILLAVIIYEYKKICFVILQKCHKWFLYNANYFSNSFVGGRRMGDRGDRNGWKWLQIGAFGAKGKKNTPVFPFCWEYRGFSRFGKDRLTKKETAFQLSLWCARRDLNSTLSEYMVFLKLLFA